jgi:hypothetical protein
MADPPDECRWPALPGRYDAALREAVAFVLHTIDDAGSVVGIVATGTIVRGAPHASSDLDVCVVNHAPYRRRVQRCFGGVPAEIFVNPPAAVRAYFAAEHADGEPVTAHMLATGVVVLARDPVVDVLRAEAGAWLARPSYPDAAKLVRARYAAASEFEDATDVAARDPETAAMVLASAVAAMLRLRCRVAFGAVPRRKELLARVAAADAAVGDLARRFYSDAPFTDRLAAAEQIADRVLDVRGFFEWDSGEEPWAGPEEGEQ